MIQSSAGAAVALQSDDGSLPAGHNGPYHDVETPVRNTGHWLISFLKAYSISGDGRFADAARRAAAFLSSAKARPEGATFWHRDNPSKDSSNGLIGQAWTVEALATVAAPLQMPELAALAEEVFLLHPFDEDLGLWQRVDIDGTPIGFDATFNHQLWFAATGSLLPPGRDGAVDRRVERFVELLPQNMSQYPTGLIRHALERQLPIRKPHRLKGRVVNILSGWKRGRRDGKAVHHKAVGYHAFNLYAISMLASSPVGLHLASSGGIRDAVHYIETDEYLRGLENNRFGYPYNPPGFEVAYALQVFADEFQRDVRPEMARWVSRQLQRCYDFESHRMEVGTEDPATQAARLYEATRLPDLTVTIDNGSK